jgi:hypothetical protein
MRHEHERLNGLFVDMEVQIAVDFHLQRSTAVRALCRQPDRERSFSQLPLHEGRRNRVLCSGGI